MIPSLMYRLAEPATRREMPSSPWTRNNRVHERYKVIGFISSGTYGRVYKAVYRNGQPGEFAIKKFKPDKEGEIVQYTGISMSACREMALCTELSHPNVIGLVEIILEDRCIYMVFEYAEHDLLQIIHHHTQSPRQAIAASTVRSVLFQILNGLYYLHSNWVLHRDLKPANIMVTSRGEVRIGDLGLARLFYKPLNTLFNGDKVVVTIWYRAPELLLGSRHYTPAIDLWAVGCIFAELLSLRPIFKGEEAKMDKKTVPFQRNQMQKIVDVMGMPTRERWPGLIFQPEHGQLQTLSSASRASQGVGGGGGGSRGGGGGASSSSSSSSGLDSWYWTALKNAGYSTSQAVGYPGPQGLDLLSRLLEYDPERRISAKDALEHSYFSENDEDNGGRVSANCFEGLATQYPPRRVTTDDNDIRNSGSSLPGTKRGGLPDDTYGRPAKRGKEGGV